MLLVKIIENNTMYSVQELHLFLCSFSPAIFTSWIFSVHSSTNLPTHFFLYLQCSKSKCSPTSHDLSHSHLQLLEFQIQLYHIHLYQSTLCIHICIHQHPNVVCYYKRLHLIQIYTYQFHVTLTNLHLIKVLILQKKHFFNKSKHLFIILFFFIKYLWMSNISSTTIASESTLES